jgi:hypothetical protein
MGFDPNNCSLKIQESTRTPIPKVRAHLGVWGFIPSHSPTFPGAWNVTSKAKVAPLNLTVMFNHYFKSINLVTKFSH